MSSGALIGVGLEWRVMTLLRYFIIFTNKLDFIPPQSPTKKNHTAANEHHCSKLCISGCTVNVLPNMAPRLQASWVHKLTSFSPQILLMMELEAGLAEGPRTATTPFDMIWHTERKQRERVEGKMRKEKETETAREKKSVSAFKESNIKAFLKNLSHLKKAHFSQMRTC